MAFSRGYYDNYGHEQNLRFLLHWELEWAGFVGKGHELERAGWKASEVRHHATFASCIYLENKEHRCVLQSSYIDDRIIYEQYNMPQYGGRLRFGMKYCAEDFSIVTHSPNFSLEPISLQPMEMSPLDMQRIKYSSLSPFNKLVAEETKRIILPQELDVDQMLQAILEKQQPAQVEYFNNKVKENQMPASTLTAQIIQLRA